MCFFDRNWFVFEKVDSTSKLKLSTSSLMPSRLKVLILSAGLCGKTSPNLVRSQVGEQYNEPEGVDKFRFPRDIFQNDDDFEH